MSIDATVITTTTITADATAIIPTTTASTATTSAASTTTTATEPSSIANVCAMNPNSTMCLMTDDETGNDLVCVCVGWA